MGLFWRILFVVADWVFRAVNWASRTLNPEPPISRLAYRQSLVRTASPPPIRRSTMPGNIPTYYDPHFGDVLKTNRFYEVSTEHRARQLACRTILAYGGDLLKGTIILPGKPSSHSLLAEAVDYLVAEWNEDLIITDEDRIVKEPTGPLTPGGTKAVDVNAPKKLAPEVPVAQEAPMVPRRDVDDVLGDNAWDYMAGL